MTSHLTNPSSPNWIIPRPSPHDVAFTLFFRRDPGYTDFADLFSGVLPIIQAYQPRLRQFHRHLVCYGGAPSLIGSALAFSLKNFVLLKPILEWATTIPDFLDAGDTSFYEGNFLNGPLVFFPWSIWTVTTAAAFSSPYWLAPDSLLRSTYQWGTPPRMHLTAGEDLFIKLTTQLLQIPKELNDENYRAAYHFWANRLQLPSLLRKWRNTPYLIQQARTQAEAQTVTREAREALQQSLNDRYITAPQIAVQWPVSAPWIRHHLWSVIPTLSLKNPYHGHPIRLAQVSIVNRWRQHHHADWPVLR